MKMIKIFFSKLLQILIKGLWWPPVALLMLAIYWWSVAHGIPKPPENDLDKFGLYGDSFGQLTSLFTALGFGGLIITLMLQQRQIRMQEAAAVIQNKRDEKARYEEVLFRLLDTYRQTLSEVRVGELFGRDVLKRSLDRVDKGLFDDGTNRLPGDLLSKLHKGELSVNDQQRIDYLHYRNFKIVAVEINPQKRLVDTFEVLLEHMCKGAPEHLLINTYRNLVFAQITFIESRYFFLVALSHTQRSNLRDLLQRTGFFERTSWSQTHSLHRDMYKEYWGVEIEPREYPPSNPIPRDRIKNAFRAHRSAGGIPNKRYTPLGVRDSQSSVVKNNGDK